MNIKPEKKYKATAIHFAETDIHQREVVARELTKEINPHSLETLNICFLSGLKKLSDDVERGKVAEALIISGDFKEEELPKIETFFKNIRQFGWPNKTLVEFVKSGRKMEAELIKDRTKDLIRYAEFYKTYASSDIKRQEELMRLSRVIEEIIKSEKVSNDNITYIRYIYEKNIQERNDKDDQHKRK